MVRKHRTRVKPTHPPAKPMSERTNRSPRERCGAAAPPPAQPLLCSHSAPAGGAATAGAERGGRRRRSAAATRGLRACRRVPAAAAGLLLSSPSLLRSALGLGRGRSAARGGVPRAGAAEQRLQAPLREAERAAGREEAKCRLPG